ncbi:MAG: DUF3857 domain-containing protein [Sandaracinaceae bacterium]|nr:DUF3857 domain-containing protein [Sandaracinaceae bacterium]
MGHPCSWRPLGLGLGLLVLLASCPALAQDNPFLADQARLADQVRRAGASGRAILPLLELDRGWGDVPPSVAMGHLERLASERRLSPAVRAYARALRARGRLRMGDPDAERREVDALGYLRAWRVVGPFDNEGKTGFAREYPPEAQRMGPIVEGATFEGRERDVAWREYPDVTHGGYVSFDAVFRPNANVCGYAETFVQSERAQALSLWVGGGGATRVWWNGEVVLEDTAYRTPHPDRAVAMLGAHAGLNRLLVKTCATDGVWGFYARVADARGEPARGVTSRSTATAEEVAAIAAGHGGPRLPRAPMAPFAALSAAAEGENASAQALEDLARFLVMTGADDPAEERARDLAARAAEAEPNVERLAFAASLATQRGVAMRFLARARALAPNDPITALFGATIAAGGPNPEDALPILDALDASTVQGMRGAILASSILNTLGLGETARARVEAVAARAPGAPRWIAARAGAAGTVMRRDAMIELRREVLAAQWDDLGSRRVLIDDGLTRGDADAVFEQLDVYQRLAADRAATYVMAAEIYEAFGRTDEALATFRRGLEIAPEEAGLMVAQGHMLLRLDQTDAAAATFREALALRPQDAPTRELLEHLQPEERQDEAFAASPETLLARRRDGEGYPLTMLQDLDVTTVFPSGLGSKFRQVAVQINDAEGARQWRSFPIQFDPDVQRIDIRQARVLRNGQQLSAARLFEQQLGEPWYHMYYDTRALVVLFPDLEPGDVVDIQYRVDDVAPRNLFDDYFGALTYLQRTVPVARFDYVLIAPRARELHFNHPQMTGLAHDVTEEGEQRIHHFHVDDVPALRPETSMPGMTELVPYLHVSTYATWEAVGRWYWGLIQDQLHADEDLQRTVRELVADAPDLRTKVQRIYDWVIRNTRYVALEFGIHGFLPYRVPEIVDRGFGDCKDKASLIYTMLREAGIDARIVLTRTRRNGHIHDLPASLAVFDHAIAYVPELDLYLDGTAEFTGIDELPRMDQGVTVLRVGPDDVTLAQTPILPSASARKTRTVDVTLNADGSGRVSVNEEIVGVESPSYRSRYQAEGLRRERLERAARGLFPGVELGEIGFQNLDDFNAPVHIHYTATAPTLAVRDGPALRIAPSVLDDLASTLARASDRRLPLELGALSSYAETRNVRLPNGWHVAELPAGGVAESRFGRLAVEVSRDGRAVRAVTTFSIETDRVAPEDYREFRQWVEQADRILRQRLVLAAGAES